LESKWSPKRASRPVVRPGGLAVLIWLSPTPQLVLVFVLEFSGTLSSLLNPTNPTNRPKPLSPKEESLSGSPKNPTRNPTNPQKNPTKSGHQLSLCRCNRQGFPIPRGMAAPNLIPRVTCLLIP
jgi:hypothetical protein